MGSQVPNPLKSFTFLEFVDAEQVRRSGRSFLFFHGDNFPWEKANSVEASLKKTVRGLAAYSLTQPACALDSWFLCTYPDGLAVWDLSTLVQTLQEDDMDLEALGFPDIGGYFRFSKHLTSSPSFFPLLHRLIRRLSSGLHVLLPVHPET